MKSGKQKLVKASLEALASLEEAIKAVNKTNLPDKDKKRIAGNMLDICKLTEKLMYCSEEQLEEMFTKGVEKQFDDMANILTFQLIYKYLTYFRLYASYPYQANLFY